MSISGDENWGIVTGAIWRRCFTDAKAIIGKKLRAKTGEIREIETILGSQMLNRFFEHGRCESMLVAQSYVDLDLGLAFICTTKPFYSLNRSELLHDDAG